MNSGDDVAGIVEKVGSSVFDVKPGDRVAAFHRMGYPGGSFAEYCVAPSATTFFLPPSVSFEDGATLPLPFMTAALGIYQYLQFPLPNIPGVKDMPVVIYGGATTVGGYALQFAKLSQLNPIIAVAGHGIDHVKSLGAATHIVDYRKGDVSQQILAAAGGKKLTRVLDIICGHGSYEHLSKAVLESTNGEGGHINMLDPPSADVWSPPRGIRLTRTFVASAYGEKHDWITEEQAKDDADFAYFFYRYLSRLLADGRIKTPPVHILPGGLDTVVAGLTALKGGKVSGKKLVVR